MEWNGMEWDISTSHCLVMQKINGMEWSVMELIPSHTTHLINFSFPPNWEVSNGREHSNNKITT